MKLIKWKQKGMLTVEASFIISMTVIVVGIMLSMMIHGYCNCWYTQAACETVLAGSSQGVLKESSGLEESQKRWNILKKECYLVPNEFAETLSENNQKLIFSCKGNTSIWGTKKIEMTIRVEQKICKPVNYIRKIMMVDYVVGGIYDAGI